MSYNRAVTPDRRLIKMGYYTKELERQIKAKAEAIADAQHARNKAVAKANHDIHALTDEMSELEHQLEEARKIVLDVMPDRTLLAVDLKFRLYPYQIYTYVFFKTNGRWYTTAQNVDMHGVQWNKVVKWISDTKADVVQTRVGTLSDLKDATDEIKW
jgi:hypothetical protein